MPKSVAWKVVHERILQCRNTKTPECYFHFVLAKPQVSGSGFFFNAKSYTPFVLVERSFYEACTEFVRMYVDNDRRVHLRAKELMRNKYWVYAFPDASNTMYDQNGEPNQFYAYFFLADIEALERLLEKLFLLGVHET